MDLPAAQVTALYCYPIKSCAGTEMTEAVVTSRGIEGDRGMMVVNPAGRFLTQREHPRMALIQPVASATSLTVSAPGMPPLAVDRQGDGPRRAVIVWRDRCQAVDQGDEAAGWFSDFLGRSCRLVRLPDDVTRPVNPRYARRPDDQVAFSDGFPFLLLSEESLADLNARLAAPLEMRRFRPNIVVAGAGAYAEDGWRHLRIGALTFDVVKPCQRCAITTVDQATAERGTEPLRTLATYRQVPSGGVMFGQNLLHDGEGYLRVGDAVTVLAVASRRLQYGPPKRDA
jgi:uncharacterized protein YcbX